MFISSLSPEVIKWPSNERKQQSANYFAQLGFPKAIGTLRNDVGMILCVFNKILFSLLVRLHRWDAYSN